MSESRIQIDFDAFICKKYHEYILNELIYLKKYNVELYNEICDRYNKFNERFFIKKTTNGKQSKQDIEYRKYLINELVEVHKAIIIAEKKHNACFSSRKLISIIQSTKNMNPYSIIHTI